MIAAPVTSFASLNPEVCARALDARDARFDGLFFVGITTTRIYCRPICPARISHADRRRFFGTAVAAEQAGFRPCLRCRPELAPGRAPVDAVPRLARAAAARIGAGALNGRTVTSLATELGVSARHLRRVLERELGVSPAGLAQVHRLLLAKRLLADTGLPVTRIAYASGFQSLRRFNAAFRERYRMPPSAVRRRRPPDAGSATEDRPLRLTLAYRAPLDWDGLLELLRRDAVPGVEVVHAGQYARSIRLDGRTGAVAVRHARTGAQLDVDISASLVPVLMPLIPRLRRLLDLDAEPLVVDGHLERAGLAESVGRRPGVRVPGAMDPLEVVLRTLVRGRALERLAGLVCDAADGAWPLPSLLPPEAGRLARIGVAGLTAVGIPPATAVVLGRVACALADGTLRLEPDGDATAAHAALRDVGVPDSAARRIVCRAIDWPDAFPLAERSLVRRAEAWRPWRAYGAAHLRLDGVAGC